MKSVLIVHVGCIRCAMPSTDHTTKIHARVILTVEFIRTCICLFFLHVQIQFKSMINTNPFFDLFDFQECAVPGHLYVNSVFIVHVGGTRCVTSSTDNNLKIRARITLTVEVIRTCIFIF